MERAYRIEDHWLNMFVAKMQMAEMRMQCPKFSNGFSRNVRFWFTKDGWEKYGRGIIREAGKYGTKLKIISRRFRKSEVLYRDRWQVTLLPPNKK